MNRFAVPIAFAVGFILMSSVPGQAGSETAQPRVAAVQPRVAPAPNVPSTGAQQKNDAAPANDFAGLDYTDEQKAEIARIHRDAESRKAVIAKADQLNADQKNAMLLGYTRMEYGEIFRVLSPAQQRHVRERILARRTADKGGPKKQPPAK
jgi:Spy/CpxP family protein refolding chaperone